VVSEIKNEINILTSKHEEDMNSLKSKYMQIMEKINILTSNHEHILKEMNSLKGMIQQLLEEKQGIVCTSGNDNTDRPDRRKSY
jgi:hypothetical protein